MEAVSLDPDILVVEAVIRVWVKGQPHPQNKRIGGERIGDQLDRRLARTGRFLCVCRENMG